GKVRNPFEARRKVRLRGEPPDMRPQKAILPGRVDVVCCIRRDMVMAMVTGPPKGPPLGAGSAEDGKRELTSAGSLERTMGKIPVIPASDGKHPKEIEGDSDHERGPAPSHPDHAEAH